MNPLDQEKISELSQAFKTNVMLCIFNLICLLTAAVNKFDILILFVIMIILLIIDSLFIINEAKNILNK